MPGLPPPISSLTPTKIKKAASKIAEISINRNLQDIVGKSNVNLKKANIKTFISMVICNEHDIVTL